MRKITKIITSLVLCTLASTVVLTSNAEAQSTVIRRYGPYAGASSDSGTCGNNWASDAFKRSFTVNMSNPDVVTEYFTNGIFITATGASPNACAIMAGPNGNGNTVGNDVSGSFSGSFDILVTGGTFNKNAKCTLSTCNTTVGFIQTVYGPSATYTTGYTFFEFDYYTQKNGSWHNASTNHGGDQGDITG